MKKESLFPLIFGLILGVLLMFFWQLGVKLNEQNTRLKNIEQVSQANSQTIQEIINFISAATSPSQENMLEGQDQMFIEE